MGFTLAIVAVEDHARYKGTVFHALRSAVNSSTKMPGISAL